MVILSFMDLFALLLSCLTLSLTSLMFGTAISAAAVGVAARLSATKSAIVKSISCPTALMTGISQS